MKVVNGFSKLSRNEKIDWLGKNYLKEAFLIDSVSKFWMDNEADQDEFESLSENTISNFHLPFGLAPNLTLNGKTYCLPMATEESSVVAAMAMTSKFWSSRGGVKARIISHNKTGHIHFLYTGDHEKLVGFWKSIAPILIDEVESLDTNMKKRGGGLKNINLVDLRSDKNNYYNLEFVFDTCDAMGANYINSILEKSAIIFKREMSLRNLGKETQIIMSILSNYTPECLVEVKISCPISRLGTNNPLEFAQKFKHAVEIANCNMSRAVTHNKGIMNGIDSVVVATGNDFRAIEAGIHSYCCKDGKYRGLGICNLLKNTFEYKLVLPLSLGTVGGVTSLHPLAKFSLDILQRPSAKELMMIVAAAGIMQNFAAVKALTTVGIQKGHMRMHLRNVLCQLNATKKEKKYIEENTNELIISYESIREMLYKLRNHKQTNINI